MRTTKSTKANKGDDTGFMDFLIKEGYMTFENGQLIDKPVKGMTLSLSYMKQKYAELQKKRAK